MTDLYAVLGVARDAPADEIKRAYRRRAREAHPDTGGDDDAFKQLTHAYQVLSDPARRARYDRTGDDGTGPATGDPFGFGAGFGGLGDVIDAFFGSAFGSGAAQPRRTSTGRDVLVGIEIDLEDVALGTREPVEVELATVCDQCGGSGSSTGSAPATCSTCAGRGQVQRVVRSAFGQLATTQTCPTCHGSGRSVVDPCRGCGGQGRRSQQRTITVDIPPGVEDGDRLRVAGAGEAGRNGGPSGDLYVEIHVREHDLFERDGRDLWAELPISVTQALLGATLRVPTIHADDVEVSVPAGVQPGEVLVVRHGGLPSRGGGSAGDLRVRVRVVIPRNLGQEERGLVEQLANLRGDDVGDGSAGLLSRLREVFR